MAAPFATMHLADLGARVLKVENPATGGDPVRATGPFVEGESSPFARLNRNKESVGLDLKHPEGLAAFRRLVESADVLVENLRPGTMRRLGLGYEELRELNPRLIYASASGWGQDGPLAMLPGLDIMAQARGGLMSITGTADGDPVKIGVPICDLVCAMYVSMAVLAALRQRDLDGEGQHLDVSLLEAGVSFAIWEAGKYFATGEVGAPLGSAHQSTAPYQAVRTADGHVTVGAVTPKTWDAFCRALDLDELLDDERYADASSRHAHRPTLIPAIEARHHHPHHRRGHRAARRGRRALRPDRELRAGLQRRPPQPARLLLGRRAPGHGAGPAARVTDAALPDAGPPRQRRSAPRPGHPRRARGGGGVLTRRGRRAGRGRRGRRARAPRRLRRTGRAGSPQPPTD